MRHRLLSILLFVSASLFSQTKLKCTLQFDENPYNHNMHIASDGRFYYTINGGQTSGKIGKFKLDGTLVGFYPIMLDGRGLSYNNSDQHFYVSTYAGDVARVDDMENGKFEVLHHGIMQSDQCSFAISCDGKSFYDFSKGVMKVHDLKSGAVLKTMNGFKYGTGASAANFGGDEAVAVDVAHIYTWDSGKREVYVYDLNGKYEKTYSLEFGDNGHSLSITNGFLFVSRDGNYSMGTWYGYPLQSAGNCKSPMDIQFFENPMAGSFTVGGEIDSIQVLNASGDIVMRMDSTQTSFGKGVKIHSIDLVDYKAGEYSIIIYDIEGGETFENVTIE